MRADWQAIVQGDEAEFARLVESMTPGLASLCYRLLGWRTAQADLEDVLQEVFTRVWAKRASFRGQASVETWITSIALNVCRAQIRRAQLWKKCCSLLRPAAEMTPPPAEDDRLPPVVRAMEGLPPLLKEVIVLHYIQGETIETIAGVLGVRKNTVEVRLQPRPPETETTCGET